MVDDSDWINHPNNGRLIGHKELVIPLKTGLITLFT